jgi:type VI secretion system secreted protein Hcp
MPESLPTSLPAGYAASVASDIFLRVKTKRAGRLKGEATAPDHEDDIVVSAWGWGMSAGSALGSGQATARRSYKHLTIVKGIDSASTGLLSALATNDEVKEARLAMRKAGDEQVDYFSIVLAGARVVAIDLDVDQGGTPVERVQFAFTKVDVEYRRQEGSGQAGASSLFSDEVLQA